MQNPMALGGSNMAVERAFDHLNTALFEGRFRTCC
jgi:hypothetical protein